MKPVHDDDWLTVHNGDCRDVLPTLPAESVQCVVTSPPYWGLRDYGTATWDGGDEGCDHEPAKRAIGNTPSAKSGYAMECPCGARRIDRQLGLEPTPEEYVANLVAVFREVRRVLRSDGTVWLNLGDSYAAGGSGPTGEASTLRGNGHVGGGPKVKSRASVTRSPGPGLKPKDLVGIPWRVAFALQADGWYLRSDIIWSKPNPMPESVTDRPTKAHEYVFLLSKEPRYYFDQEAVREPAEMREWREGRENAITAYPGSPNRYSDGPSGYPTNPSGRNIRSVWNIATQPYPGAHFAVFPEALVEPCIKAGCPEGGMVLDPFGGSGTVGKVANRLSRRAVLIELNPAYIEQVNRRNADMPLGL